MHTEYPTKRGTPSLLGEDRISYYQRLMDESARLFKSSAELEIEVLELQEEPKGARRGSPLNTFPLSGSLLTCSSQ